MAAVNLETRGRAATVTALHTQKIEPLGSVEMERTSSDSNLARSNASNAAEREEAAVRAIAEAKAVRAELTSSNANGNAGDGVAPVPQQQPDVSDVNADQTDGANQTDGAKAARPPKKKSLSTSDATEPVKFDPWLEKTIPESEAAGSSGASFSRTRFFGNRSETVATRVSRWMPFDSQSDAKAASRRSAADWWQTPEDAVASNTVEESGAQVTELAPTNPFADDVKRVMEKENTENDAAEESGDAVEAAAAASDETSKAADSSEITPADETAASATVAEAKETVTTLASTGIIEEKKTEDAWKLMLKSALLSQMVNRDKHSSAAEYHPYIVLLKEGKLVIHHQPEFFREIGGKNSSLADQVGKRPPLMELKLEPSMRFSAVERRRVLSETRARLHMAKLQSWQQRQFRGIRAFLGSSTRTEVRTVLKVGCGSLTTLESFMEAIDREIRLMPVEMSQEVSFRRDEIYCDLVDDCDVQLAFDGTLLSRRSTVHVMVMAFISGEAECQMVLNDRKLAQEQRNSPTGMFLPPSKHLIDMANVECHHSATNREVFEKHRLVRFSCMKGLRLEALRFQVTGSLPPPLEVRGLLCETVDNAVNLRANLKWHQQAGKVRFTVHDIEFHIPVPSSWCGVLETKNALGMRRSIKARNSFRGSIRRKRQTANASLDVTVGSAKYEPESDALVWRIDDFPTDRNANATLTCRLELTPSMERADFENKQCVMKYGVAGSCVSGTTVWSLQVPQVQEKPVKKWVKYDTKFRYGIDMLPSNKYEIAGEDD